MTKTLWRYQDSLLVILLNQARKVDSMNYDTGNDNITILDPLLGLLCAGQKLKYWCTNCSDFSHL